MTKYPPLKLVELKPPPGVSRGMLLRITDLQAAKIRKLEKQITKLKK